MLGEGWVGPGTFRVTVGMVVEGSGVEGSGVEGSGVDGPGVGGVGVEVSANAGLAKHNRTPVTAKIVVRVRAIMFLRADV